MGSFRFRMKKLKQKFDEGDELSDKSFIDFEEKLRGLSFNLINKISIRKHKASLNFQNP